MGEVFRFVVIVLLLINNVLIGQVNKRVTLIISKDQSVETGILESIKSELGKSKLIDSVLLKGVSYPIIFIKPYQDYLQRNNLTYQYIFKVLKRELAIPIWEDADEKAFYCKLSDYKAFNGTDHIDKIDLIPFKNIYLHTNVYLMQVANIYLKLKTDDVFYQNKQVYSISFNFKGKTNDEFKQVLDLVDKYKLKYEIDNELLSNMND